MKQLALLLGLLVGGWQSIAQSFEVAETAETYQVSPNQMLRIPIRLKNTSEKTHFYVVRVIKSDWGDTQKGYFCLGATCWDANVEEITKKLEPGETAADLHFTFESGIQAMQSGIKIEVFPRSAPNEVIARASTLLVEEKPNRSFVFQSREITIHDVYPNPVQDQAFIDYKLHTEAVKAKIVVHNVLGKAMGDYELAFEDTRVKIQADDLVPGIYFYTVYLSNNGILTRKLIVRK
ncbi:MAG: T9SS type A sorting domain-containing protein [Flammeovirgaceae bacterium]